MKQIAILGGSSPFTLDLILALRNRAAELPRLKIILHGQNQRALANVHKCAQSVLQELDWNVAADTQIEQVLTDANLVIQQIRFDGLAGRQADEAFAESAGCAADETLGPAALRRILASHERLRQLGATIAKLAPQATVLNLTNPLSLTTSVLQRAGVQACFGVCELPGTTARQAARLLGASVEHVEFEYVGLNHRGFVVGLRSQGRDLLKDMLATGQVPAWTDLDTVRRLGALPTKYFRLAQGQLDARTGHGRARELAALRTDLLSSLNVNATQIPQRLDERITDWYDEALVPILIGLFSERPSSHILNSVRADGITVEGWARLSASEVKIMPTTQAPPAVEPWIQRFQAHERCMLELLETPNEQTLRSAIKADPAIPVDRHTPVFEAGIRLVNQAAQLEKVIP